MRNAVTLLLTLLLLTGGSIQPAAATTPAMTETSLPRLVDLGADKCVPCKLMAPILAELKQQYSGHFEVEFIDVWQNRDLATTYSVKMIPTQIFYDAAGNELQRHAGFLGKEEILATWRQLGYRFDSNDH